MPLTPRRRAVLEGNARKLIDAMGAEFYSSRLKEAWEAGHLSLEEVMVGLAVLPPSREQLGGIPIGDAKPSVIPWKMLEEMYNRGLIVAEWSEGGSKLTIKADPALPTHKDVYRRKVGGRNILLRKST